MRSVPGTTLVFSAGNMASVRVVLVRSNAGDKFLRIAVYVDPYGKSTTYVEFENCVNNAPWESTVGPSYTLLTFKSGSILKAEFVNSN